MEMTLDAVGRKRPLVALPFALMHLPASVLQLLPNPPLTRDQLYLLESDNIVSKEALGFDALGIMPQSVEAHIGDYLAHLRPGGRFAAK